MKTIEIRRHSIRSKPGQNLSQQGVSLARLVGDEMGPFERVVTSPLARAVQTAVAMGFAVDETVELLGSMDDAVSQECPWPASFSEYAAAVRRGAASARYAASLAEYYSGLVKTLPEGGAALVINHGGIVELSALGCLPGADLAHLGDYIDFCEGVRLTWEDGAFTRAERLHV